MILAARNVTASAMYHRRRSVDASPHSVISGPLRMLELAFQEADTRKAEVYRRGMLPDRPTFIQHGPLRLLICAAPHPDTLALDRFANLLASYNVKHVVRACEPTYNSDHLHDLGFVVHECPFADGEVPSEPVIAQWLQLLDHVFHIGAHHRRISVTTDRSDLSSDSDASLSPCSSADKPKETIAVHCVAGLGRAPLLVAIALVQLGMGPFEAVGCIRAMRRGAINGTQMAFVEDYSRRPPPPPPEKPRRTRSRSGSFVGMLFPSFKGARPFRPRTPPQQRQPVSPTTSPPTHTRVSLHLPARVHQI